MRNVAIVLSLIFSCAGLAACGDSSSDSSSTKTAASAPDGKSTGTTTCTPPTFSDATFTSFDAVNVDCAEATTALKTVYEHGAVSGWTCQPRIVGQDESTSCAKDADTTQTFAAAWTVG